MKEYDEGFSFLDVVDLLDKLSTILQWQNGEEDCGILVRRGMLRWRLRNLAGARADLRLALKLSPTLPIHHLLAIVQLELRSHREAMSEAELALARDGRDSVACAVRSQIHSFYGRISAATRDAEAASQAANTSDPDHPQNSRVAKTTYSPHPSRTVPDTPLPELPDLPNLLAGFAWLRCGCFIPYRKPVVAIEIDVPVTSSVSASLYVPQITLRRASTEVFSATLGRDASGATS